MCGEMRLFLDTWAVHQTEQKIGFGALKVIDTILVACSSIALLFKVYSRDCQHSCFNGLHQSFSQKSALLVGF